jgi:16S rRNA (cytosine1402-N4)-methyltransferase
LPRSWGSTDVDHLPVLLGEAVEALAVSPSGTYVDATYGAGGHARAIVERGGRVIAFEADPSVELAQDLADRVALVRGNFGDLEAGLTALGVTLVDGALFDLGISSLQLAAAERGFSLQRDGPLDMRLNPHAGRSAYELLATIDERGLADLIYEYGEERASRRIARAVIAARAAGTLPSRTLGFADLVARAVRAPGWQRIHPATRTFQALRIAVNDELGALRRGLDAAANRTRPGGRIAVISFHSLEDRIVKQTFRDDARLRALTKKPILPSRDEVVGNPRGRSAKLRVAERVA